MGASVQDKLIAGRYRLVRPLSAGGMGQVYRAVDTQLFDRPVAVKILHQHLGGDDETLDNLKRRFEAEAQISVLLGEHPHIITILDYGIEDHSPYLVMELLSGCSLSELLIKEGAMAPERVITLGRQMCGAFHHAHQFQVELGDRMIMGVIHRDIKPSNLFILKDKTQQESVKVLDFGIAKVISDVSMALGTQTGSFLGTLRYASPEQLDGEPLTIQSDIYSFGIVLYQMLTGEMPIRPATDTFPGWYRAHHEQQPRPPHQISSLPTIPIQLAEAVMACLEKHPAQRPPDMHALERSLADCLQNQSSPLPPLTRAPRSQPIASTPTPAPPDPPSRTYQLSGGSPSARSRSRSRSRYPVWLPWAGLGTAAGLAAALLVGIVRTITSPAPAPPPLSSVEQSPSPPAADPDPPPQPLTSPMPSPEPIPPTVSPDLEPQTPQPVATDSVSGPFTCRLDYSIRTAWDQGFVMDLWINVSEAPVSDWQLSWRFPSERVQITNFWKGDFTQQGARVQVTHLGYNSTIPQGGRTDLGFEARHPGGVAIPEQITLNGTPCQVSAQSAAAPRPTATATPQPISTPQATPTSSREIRIQVDRDGVQIEGLEGPLEEIRERAGLEPGELLRRMRR